MRTTVQLPTVGKLSRRPITATLARSQPSLSRLFFITDYSSRAQFLVDTGAAVSVIPRILSHHTPTPSHVKLYAANNTAIATYGEERLILNLGFPKKYPWHFIIANVTHPILGADFLSHYDLLVDLNNKRLIDNVTTTSVRGTRTNLPSQKISTITPHCPEPYKRLLQHFSAITVPRTVEQPVLHNVVHHIITTGPPIHAKTRRLDLIKLQAAKEQFNSLLQLGYIRPSSSPWSSPLHMIKNQTGKWRATGDYRAINSVTTPSKSLSSNSDPP